MFTGRGTVYNLEHLGIVLLYPILSQRILGIWEYGNLPNTLICSSTEEKIWVNLTHLMSLTLVPKIIHIFFDIN